MKPSQPDDAGAPSPGQPPRPGHKPVPPAVVYALDCLERGSPAQVRRHLLAVGYTAAEAADAVRQAQAHQDEEQPSAWSPEDAPARRCLSLGFLLFVLGIIAGCCRMYLLPYLPASTAVALNVFAWVSILGGIAVLGLGIAQMRIGRS